MSLTGLEITASQRTMSELIWEFTGQPFVLPVMLTGHIWSFWKWNKLKFPCCSVVESRCVLSFAELYLKSWVKCNKNLCLQFGHISWTLDVSSGSGTPELKCLVTKLFSMNTNFSSLVMRSNMDYWRSFRIKISHRDTYTRNHYICGGIYLFTKCVR